MRDQQRQNLEEKLAHLERVTEELSDVVADQARRIVTLEARVNALREAEAERQAEGAAVFGDQRPPHW